MDIPNVTVHLCRYRTCGPWCHNPHIRQKVESGLALARSSLLGKRKRNDSTDID